MEAWFKNSAFCGDHYKYDDACRLIEKSNYFTEGKSNQRIMLTDNTKIKLMGYLKYVKNNCFEYDDELYEKSKSQFKVQAKKLKNLDHISISPICLPDDNDTFELKGLYNKYKENLKMLTADWNAKIALKAKSMNNNSNSNDLFPENFVESAKETTNYEP